MTTGPKGWRSLVQKEFIELWMSEFLVKKASKRLDEFWAKMIEAFLTEFPEEVALGLPVQNIELDPNADPPRELTKEEKATLSDVITARTKQLHNSFNNGYTALVKKRGGVGRSTSSLAATLFKARPKRKHRHQVLEVYQKEYKTTVQKALSASEFETMNEAAQCRDDDGKWVDDNNDEIKVKRISEARRQRMKVQRRVVQELWDKEDESVKGRIRELAKEEVVVPEATEMEEVDGKILERTPEEYQMSLDESLQVAEMFLTEFPKMTGWVGVLVYAGPVPRMGGELGMKSCCFGSTPGGVNFEQWHDNWKKGVAGPLGKFARQAISRQTRLSRALYSAEGEDDSDADEPTQQKKKKKSKSKDSDGASITPAVNDSRESTPAPKSKPPRRPRKSKPQKSDDRLLASQHVPANVPTPPDTESPTMRDLSPETQSTTMAQTAAEVPAGTMETYQHYENRAQQEMDDTEYFENPPDLDDTTHLDGSTLAFDETGEFDFNFDFDNMALSQNVSIVPPSHDLGSAALSHDFSSAASGYPLAGATSGFFFPVRFGSGPLGVPSSSPLADELNHLSGSRNDSWGLLPSSGSTDQGAQDLGLGRQGPQNGENPPTRPVPRPLFKQPGFTSHEDTPFAFGRQPRFRSLSTNNTSPAIATHGLIPHAPHTPTSKHAASAPKQSSPLAHPPMQPVAEAIPASAPIVHTRLDTPKTPRSTLTNLGGSSSGSLPPRMRLSPTRQGSTPLGVAAPRSPPIYPRSRPMANPPKLALMKLTPGGMAKKMAQVRQSKKAGKKKAVVRKTREKVKTSSPLQNVANTATSSNPTASAPLTPVADTPATPALVFSTTNNNRQRAVEQACRDREKEAAAAAPKLGDVQLTNPASNDYNLVVVVPAERPRRQIVPPKNRGAVVSMVDKRQAAEDGKLVKVLKESKAGRKRKAEEKTGPATAKRQG